MTKWIVNALLLGWIAAMVPSMAPSMALDLALDFPAPSALTPTAHPEPMVAPIRGDNWPVPEYPDRDEIMVAGLLSRPIPPLA